MQREKPGYGGGDASFQAAGGVTGIRRLVDDFYDLMERLPETQEIRGMTLLISPSPETNWPDFYVAG